MKFIKILGKLSVGLILLTYAHLAVAASINAFKTRAPTELSGSGAYDQLSDLTYISIIANPQGLRGTLLECYNDTDQDITLSRDAIRPSGVVPAGKQKKIPYGDYGLDWRTTVYAAANNHVTTGVIYCTLSS